MEVLVHVSASGTRKDDERYRAQATKYLGFTSVRHIICDDVSTARSEPDMDIVTTDVPAETRGVDQTDSTDLPLFLEDTQLAVSALESQIITSSLKRKLSRTFEVEAESEDSRPLEESSNLPTGLPYTVSSPSRSNAHGGQYKSSEVSTSSDHQEVSPKRARLKSPYVPLQGEGGIAIGYVGISPEKQETNGSNLQDARNSVLPAKSHSSSWPGDDVPSQLPSSYSLSSEYTSKGSRPGDQHLPSSLAQHGSTAPGPELDGHHTRRPETPLRKPAHTHGNTLSSPQVLNPTVRTSQASTVSQISPIKPFEPATEVVATIARNPTGLSVQPSADNAAKPSVVDKVAPTASTSQRDSRPSKSDDNRSAAPAGPGYVPLNPASSAHLPPSTYVDVTIPDFSSLAQTARPPPPPTSISPFKTHITPSLASLSTNSDLAGRYKPQTTTRALRTSERGHWSFDPTNIWPSALQAEFWTFLERVIRMGNVGWGVWCERGQSGHASSEDGMVGSDAANQSSPCLGPVRVFCWGEVVEHVYLLLYVASKSKIRKLGAGWVDADGEVVVKM